MSVNNGSSVYNEGGLTNADVQAIINNTPNIKNVQSDWNIFNVNSDAFIKNKPFFEKYSGDMEIIYKICSFPYLSSVAFDLITRKNAGTVFYKVINGRGALSCYIGKSGDISSDSYGLKLYSIVDGSNTIIYASTKIFNRTFASPCLLTPKNYIDFTDFGVIVESLPEGAVEIQNYYIANSSSASGNVPVKVDSYGNLTPVTMDNYPTKSSAGLVNSGKLYDVFTDDNGDQMAETPPQQVYVTGKFYFVAGKVCRCTAYSAATATFDVYGVVEALNYVLSQT